MQTLQVMRMNAQKVIHRFQLHIVDVIRSYLMCKYHAKIIAIARIFTNIQNGGLWSNS